MSKPRKHHFVASSILNRFCDRERENFWVYDHNRRSNKGVECRNPENSFFIPHDNSLIDKNGQPIDTSLETDLGKLDDDWSRFTKKIQSADAQTDFDFSRDSEIITEMFWLQFRRSPDIDLKSKFDEIQKNNQKILHPKHLSKFNDPEYQTMLRKNATVQSRRTTPSNWYTDNTEIVILSNETELDLIIGSAVTTKCTLGVFIPVSPKCAVGIRFVDKGHKKRNHITTNSNALIHELNKRIAKKSKFGFGGSDKSYITRLKKLYYP